MTVVTVLLAILLLSFIIIIHELGHYCVGRLCRVGIEEFSVGFGPKLLQWKRRGIAYSVRLILLGGYVRFAGEDAEAFAEAVKDRIAHVHLKDFALLPAPAPKAFALPSGAFAQPVVLGHGSVNVRGALATLKRISYTGRLMLEHSGPMEEQIACIQTLQTWLA